MNVLITGASGFVGGAAVRHFREAGIDTLGIGRRKLEASDYVSLDLSRPFDLAYAPDVVIHAAARSSPWGTWQAFKSQNVDATQHVIDYCCRSGYPHLIYVSSGAVVYRHAHQFAVTESEPFPATPINAYARSKQLSEQLVQQYPGKWSIVRPRAVFGPGDTVVFPRILRALQKKTLPRIVSEQPAVGDLIYIDTLVEYFFRIAAQRATGIYNVSNNAPVEIYAVVQTLCEQLGFPTPSFEMSVTTALRLAKLAEVLYRVVPFLGEPPITAFGVCTLAYSKTFNVQRALADLGRPAVSVADGLQRFISWQKLQPS